MCVFTAAALGTTAMGATMANVGLGLSVAQAGMGYVQQSRAADAQERANRANARITNQYNQEVYDRGVAQYEQESQYRADMMARQNERYTENAERAVADALRNYDLIQDRIDQENVVASMEINKIARDSRAAQSQAIAGAADREVAGQSVDYLLDAIAFNELEGAQNVRMERNWRHTALMGSMDEVQAQTQARIASANPQPIPLPALPAPMAPTMVASPVTQPSMMTAITNAATGALNSFTNFYQPQNIAPATGAYAPQSLGFTPQTTMGYGSKGFRNQSYYNPWSG